MAAAGGNHHKMSKIRWYMCRARPTITHILLLLQVDAILLLLAPPDAQKQLLQKTPFGRRVLDRGRQYDVDLLVQADPEPDKLLLFTPERTASRGALVRLILGASRSSSVITRAVKAVAHPSNDAQERSRK